MARTYLRVRNRINFLNSQPKHMLWVFKKNRLNETVLFSTQNICLKVWVRKYLLFYAENFYLSKPVNGIDLYLSQSVALAQKKSAEFVLSTQQKTR